LDINASKIEMHHHADEPDWPQAMHVFAGQKLMVVGGSSRMGRQSDADVVAVGGSAIIIGQAPAGSTTPSRHWPRRLNKWWRGSA